MYCIAIICTHFTNCHEINVHVLKCTGIDFWPSTECKISSFNSAINGYYTQIYGIEMLDL